MTTSQTVSKKYVKPIQCWVHRGTTKEDGRPRERNTVPTLYEADDIGKVYHTPIGGDDVSHAIGAVRPGTLYRDEDRPETWDPDPDAREKRLLRYAELAEKYRDLWHEEGREETIFEKEENHADLT